MFSLGMLTFLLMGLIGVYQMSMAMGDDGKMDNCPFALGDAICTMTPLDHVHTVRNFLTALPQHKDALADLLLLVSAVSVFAFLFVGISKPFSRALS